MNETVTTDWKYNGYTIVKAGEGRNARYVEKHIWICPECKHEVRGGKQKPQHNCSRCSRK